MASGAFLARALPGSPRVRTLRRLTQLSHDARSRSRRDAIPGTGRCRGPADRRGASTSGAGAPGRLRRVVPPGQAGRLAEATTPALCLEDRRHRHAAAAGWTVFVLVGDSWW